MGDYRTWQHDGFIKPPTHKVVLLGQQRYLALLAKLLNLGEVGFGIRAIV
jgi:hypothetical protein